METTIEEKPGKKKLVDAMYQYVKLGWTVIPVNGKKAALHSWEKFQNSSTSQEDIARWDTIDFTGVAIITGKHSGIIVLDIDGEKGFKSVAGKHLPPTPISKTGKGLHYVFKYPSFEVGNFVGILPGVDIRGNEGYFVAPPSAHASGKNYAWLDNFSPQETSPAEIPEWLATLLKSKKEKSSQTPSEEWKELFNGVEEGRRNHAATKIAGYWVSKGLTAEETLQMLKLWNIQNKPPLPNEELKTIVDYVINKELKKNEKPQQEEKPLKTISLEELKDTIKTWLFIEDDMIIEIPMAAIVANLFDSPMPLWLFIVAPPSSGKTELLMTLANLDFTYLISKLTPQTLISGMKIKNASLLLEMQENNKTIMLMKDYTTILAMNAEERGAIMGQLREVYDGEYSARFGNMPNKITWKGKLGFLAAVTNKIELDMVDNTQLGDRFLYFRPKFKDRIETGRRAFENANFIKEMKNKLSDSMRSFFYGLKIPKMGDIKINEDIKTKIIEMADIVSIMRCGVQRDWYSKIILISPDPEGIGRLVQQYTMLAKAMAVLKNRTECVDDDLLAIKRLCLDTIPTMRLTCVKQLYLNYSIGRTPTKELSAQIGFTTTTTRHVLEDFLALGVVKREISDVVGQLDGISQTDGDNRAWLWGLGSQFYDKLSVLFT